MNGRSLRGLEVTWRARATPLVPTIAVATEDAAMRLCAALLERSDEALGALRGVAGASVLAVSGATDDLPWVDGVAYAGRDPLAPSLFVPTHLAPSLPIDLVERALTKMHGQAGSPLLLLVTLGASTPLRVVPMVDARPIARSVLARWRDEAR